MGDEMTPGAGERVPKQTVRRKEGMKGPPEKQKRRPEAYCRP
jgi:hypothetical protein